MRYDAHMSPAKIPHRRQENDYYCGPAIVQMILAEYGMEFLSNESHSNSGPTEKLGTSLSSISKCCPRYDFGAIFERTIELRRS